MYYQILFALLLSVFVTISAQNTNISTRACGCYNEGVCDPVLGTCVCPSGTSVQCQQINTNGLCDITCRNGGVCNILSTTYSTCWCLLGFHGEYCERQAAASRCSQTQCMNGGTCYENSPGASIFAYCLCPPGFKGARCEREYFRCLQSGTFADSYGCAQGYYFLCDNANRRIAGHCPKGLRFNLMKMSCDYAKNVGCPQL